MKRSRKNTELGMEEVRSYFQVNEGDVDDKYGARIGDTILPLMSDDDTEACINLSALVRAEILKAIARGWVFAGDAAFGDHDLTVRANICPHCRCTLDVGDHSMGEGYCCPAVNLRA